MTKGRRRKFQPRKNVETVQRFWAHHRLTRVAEGCTGEEYARICRLLNIGELELAAFFAIKATHLGVFKKNGFPAHVTLSLRALVQNVMTAKYGEGTWGSPIMPFKELCDLLQGGLESGPSASLINSINAGSNPAPATTLIHLKD